jgi:alkylation response protein AidB-like acyl-CoA dehydrogenase
MNLDLTDEQRAIRTLVRDFAEAEVRPVAGELDRTKSFPYEIVSKLGKLGLMGIPYPEEHGGGGADNLSYAIAIEELTRIDSSVAITVAAPGRSTPSAPKSRRRPGSPTCAPAGGWPPSASPSRRPALMPATLARARAARTTAG